MITEDKTIRALIDTAQTLYEKDELIIWVYHLLLENMDP
jgi:hypothetical protein